MAHEKEVEVLRRGRTIFGPSGGLSCLFGGPLKDLQAPTPESKPEDDLEYLNHILKDLEATIRHVACARLAHAIACFVVATIDPLQAMRLIRLCEDPREMKNWMLSADSEVLAYALSRYTWWSEK